MPLAIKSLGMDTHTHIQTSLTEEILKNQMCITLWLRHVFGLKSKETQGAVL